MRIKKNTTERTLWQSQLNLKRSTKQYDRDTDRSDDVVSFKRLSESGFFYPFITYLFVESYSNFLPFIWTFTLFVSFIWFYSVLQKNVCIYFRTNYKRQQIFVFGFVKEIKVNENYTRGQQNLVIRTNAFISKLCVWKSNISHFNQKVAPSPNCCKNSKKNAKKYRKRFILK